MVGPRPRSTVADDRRRRVPERRGPGRRPPLGHRRRRRRLRDPVHPPGELLAGRERRVGHVGHGPSRRSPQHVLAAADPRRLPLAAGHPAGGGQQRGAGGGPGGHLGPGRVRPIPGSPLLAPGPDGRPGIQLAGRSPAGRPVPGARCPGPGDGRVTGPGGLGWGEGGGQQRRPLDVDDGDHGGGAPAAAGARRLPSPVPDRSHRRCPGDGSRGHFVCPGGRPGRDRRGVIGRLEVGRADAARGARRWHRSRAPRSDSGRDDRPGQCRERGRDPALRHVELQWPRPLDGLDRAAVTRCRAAVDRGVVDRGHRGGHPAGERGGFVVGARPGGIALVVALPLALRHHLGDGHAGGRLQRARCHTTPR